MPLLRLLDAILHMPDLQCAWQLLSRCAVPRANYFLRVLPPSAAAQYAEGHDAQLWATVVKLLQGGFLRQARAGGEAR